MKAAEALADLQELSSQIEAVVLFDSSGRVAAATIADETRAGDVARAALDLISNADQVRTGLGDERAVTQLEVALLDGSIFVVRDGDRLVTATTSPEPTTGLVLYDLRSCLRSSAPDGGELEAPEAAEAAKPKRRKPAETDAADPPRARRSSKRKTEPADG